MKTFSIGRDAGNQIFLNDNFVSRRHAELIVSDDERVMIKDLGSSNGTFVNGNRISQCYINPGDIIKCASVFLDWQQYVDSLKLNQDHSHQSQQIFHKEFPPQSNLIYQSSLEHTAYRKDNSLNPINSSAFWGSILVTVGFFLPWERVFGTNGANIAGLIANNGGKDSGYSILFYLFPISAAIFIISAITGKVSDFALAVRLIPSILLTILVIVIISKSSNNYRYNDEGGAINGNEIFQLFGIGLIFTLIGSFMMCFYPKNS